MARETIKEADGMITTRNGVPVTIKAGDLETGHVDIICHYQAEHTADGKASDVERHTYLSVLVADGGATEIVKAVEAVAGVPLAPTPPHE